MGRSHRLPFIDVLRAEFDDEVFLHKTVLVGSTAVELGDFLSVPVYRALPGVFLEAAAYESLIQGRALGRIPAVITLVLALAIAIFIGPRFVDWHWRTDGLVVLNVIAGLFVSSLILQKVAPVSVDIVPSTLVCLLSYGLALVSVINRQGWRIFSESMSVVHRRATLEAVVESSFDGIFSVGVNGKVRSLNPAAARMFDCREQDALEQPVFHFLPQFRSENEDSCAVLNAAAGERIAGPPTETTARRASGEEFPAEVSVSRTELALGNNSIERRRRSRRIILITVRDITARKMAENAVLESENRFKEFADTAADWFWEMGPDLRFTYLSERVEAVTGVPVEFHLGKTREELVGEPITEEKWQRHLRDLRERKPFRNFTYARQGPDGQIQYMSTSGKPMLDDEGAFLGYRGSAQDITAQIEAEDEARQRQTELAHVLRLNTMGEMAAALAHQLNQPLSAVVNYTRGCLHRLNAGTDERDDLVTALTEATEQAERAGRIVRDISSFVGRPQPNLVPVDVNHLVRSVIELMEPELHDRHVELSLDLDDGLLPLLAGEIETEQVVLNLVRNGVEAMLETDYLPRRLTISTRRNRGDEVDLAVSDTGPPIGAEILERMFDPFYSTKEIGMGMGLAISQTIARAHGGRLWVPDNESQTIHPIQQLPGSALRQFQMNWNCSSDHSIVTVWCGFVVV